MSTAQATPASATKAPRAPRASKKADAPKAPRKARGDKAATKPAPKAVKQEATRAPGSKTTDALREAAKHYVHNKEHKTAGGHVSVNNGDKVATMLLGKSLDEVVRIGAEVLGVTQKELREKYAHLNVGMIRMNIGNRIRATLDPKK